MKQKLPNLTITRLERLKIIAFELGVEPSIFFDTKLTKSVI